MGITHLSGLEVAGVPTMGIAGLPLFTGNYYFVDAVHGSDGNTGAADNPLATVYRAYQLMVDGNNDVCVIVASPTAASTTAGTQRLSYATAVAVDSTATSGSLVWAKSSCHLVGMCSGSIFSQRARFAPPTGTYTAATFLNGQTVTTTPFINVSGNNCYFANWSAFVGFSTGNAGFLGMVVSGSRNVFNNVNIQGMADTASAAGAAARCVQLSGSENVFNNCVLGTDTVTRATNVNATLEFTGGCARNTFNGCVFPLITSLTTSIILKAASAAIDRSQYFNYCTFDNMTKSSSAAVAAVATIGAATSPAGDFVFNQPSVIGITGFGTDATTRALIFVTGAVGAAATSGLAVNPTA